MGYSKRKVIFHYLTLALLIGVIGSIVGSIFSTIFSKVITQYYTEMLGIPFSLISINFHAIVEAVLAGSIFCILGGVIPCFKVASLKPSEAMLPYVSSLIVKGRIPLLEKMLSRTRFLSVCTKISIRNLFRNCVRTFSTVIGISLSLMLVLSMLGMMDSFYTIVDRQYNEHERWDLRVQFSTMQNINQLMDMPAGIV